MDKQQDLNFSGSEKFVQQEAIKWLTKLRDDNLSLEETHEFADWLSEDYEHSRAFAAAETLFNDMVLATQIPLVSPSSVAMLTKQRRGSHKKILKYSLSTVAACLIMFNFIQPIQNYWLTDLLSDYHTVTGEQQNINLSDGSHILLNTNSALSVNFDNQQRLITLHHGQASFTVAKDTNRPFEVLIDDNRIRALGTIFQAQTLDDHTIQINVQEHSVLVTNSKRISVKVSEGQQITYVKDEDLPQPQTIDFNQANAWQQHRLFINDKPLHELISELNRYRLGRVFIADEQLKNLRVTGVFSLDDPDQILSSVQTILNLQQTRLTSWWVILHR